ncbi:ABC transporter substrate-binding protein [Streptomyces nigra]|uniref:ABC transporter substrate-binding protein n=1 Tax=Streptomyces nigra TaxID=1827580 RepID=UPI0036C1F61B
MNTATSQGFVMGRIVSVTCAVAALGALAGCGANGSSSLPDSGRAATTAGTAPAPAPPLPEAAGSVTVGSAAFPEAELLAYVYAGAMKAHGVKVTVQPNIGERSAYMAALKDGSIGAVPEYSGALLDYLQAGSTARTSPEVYDELRAEAAEQNLRVTSYAAAQDADTITVTKATAVKYNLKSIGDLKSVAGRLTLGAPAPLRTVPYGVPALEKVYGVVFKRFVPLSPSGSITQTALRNGTVDAADIFSTDPAISRFGLVPLEDPEHIFAAQNVVPVFRQDVLTQPMADACDAVSAKLDTGQLRVLVATVIGGGAPSEVAAGWLEDNGLANRAE